MGSIPLFRCVREHLENKIHVLSRGLFLFIFVCLYLFSASIAANCRRGFFWSRMQKQYSIAQLSSFSLPTFWVDHKLPQYVDECPPFLCGVLRSLGSDPVPPCASLCLLRRAALFRVTELIVPAHRFNYTLLWTSRRVGGGGK